MNIVIGKFGKSILFDSNKWGAIGGDNEAPLLFSSMAKYNPDDNFYLIGKSDYSRLSEEKQKEINPHGNLIDVWARYKNKDHRAVQQKWILDYFALWEIKIDTGVFYNGPAGNANIPNLIKTVKGDKICKVLECFEGYVGPLVNYLNVSDIPYFTLTPDPRYHPIRARDLFNLAKFSLSQFNSTNLKVKHIKSYEDQSYATDTIPTYYTGIETVCLMKYKKPNWERWFCPKERINKFIIVLNEGGNGGLSRGPLLKNFVLDSVSDVKIYGKWNESWYEDSRFQGPKKFTEIEPILEKTKYTFIIPIEKGWVTSKFWEMIHLGIVPFMHPYYDSQNHLNVPDILRVKNKNELSERIQYLEEDEIEYENLMSKLYDLLDNKYYNSEHTNNLIMKTAQRLSGKEITYNLTVEDIKKINSQVLLKNEDPNNLSAFF